VFLDLHATLFGLVMQLPGCIHTSRTMACIPVQHHYSRVFSFIRLHWTCHVMAYINWQHRYHN